MLGSSPIFFRFMSNSLSVNATQVVDLLLDFNQQEALNEQCKRVISLLGSSFTNKVDAIRELDNSLDR